MFYFSSFPYFESCGSIHYFPFYPPIYVFWSSHQSNSLQIDHNTYPITFPFAHWSFYPSRSCDLVHAHSMSITCHLFFYLQILVLQASIKFSSNTTPPVLFHFIPQQLTNTFLMAYSHLFQCFSFLLAIYSNL